ncbi:SMI1/KNR4 family protein [Acaryochloris sp. IP29b_bin.148]|uniref:SMI1/KNR4 family protein n=1 Tax=Acaryochloris sp. IP29b_bin.148 TaxID=2969218 RepID=UPI0026061B9D|nr:SMI1/KNR4 family protein [Acaryochloris sp. IP29b_bin.148]
MTELEWKSFLIDFIRVLNVEEDDLEFRDKARQLFSSENVEAVEEDILAAEHRLKIKFPPSYHLFLKVSNGWPEMGAAEPGQLWPPQAIQWLRDQDPEMLEAWSTLGQNLSMEEHLYYRDVEEDNCRYREEYLHEFQWHSAILDRLNRTI